MRIIDCTIEIDGNQMRFSGPSELFGKWWEWIATIEYRYEIKVVTIFWWKVGTGVRQ